jgi:hypothetical protein
MKWITDKAWGWLDSVAGSLCSARIRPFLTLGWVTLFVLTLFVFAGCQRIFMPHPPLPPFQIRIEQFLRSPMFFVPYALAVLFVIWVLIGSKPRAEYIYLRALLYGMFLAGFLGSLLVLLVPWKG